MRKLVILIIVAAGAAVLAAWLLSRSSPAARDVRGGGMNLRVPKSWSSYVRPREIVAGGGVHGALLAAANFPLPRGDDDLGSRAMRRMHGDDARIFIQDLSASNTPAWYGRQFPKLAGGLSVRPRDFGRFEGVSFEHAFAHRLFSLRGREFQVTVDFAGPKARAAGLVEVNRILATFGAGERRTA